MYQILKIIFLLSLSSGLMSKEITNKELIFIYNAKSGFINELVDFAHKIISPETYDCNLCTITYGTFKMKISWANYIQELPVKSVFTYKDKLVDRKLKKIKLPAVFIRDGEKLNELISAYEINNINDLEDLIRILDTRLKEQGMNTKKKKEINLSDEEWQKKLTPEEYHILREKELRDHSQVNMINSTRMEHINVRVVILNYSHRKQNIIQVAVGLHSTNLYQERLRSQQITVLV